ncbi:MAG: TetR/AcrR family transcriptional regulator [Myxococcota bacterium]
MGVREAKKRRTGAEILEAAEALFRLRGFAETSLREIAAAAPVSVQTLYNYFGSKEGILAAIAVERFAALAGAAERVRHEFFESEEATGTPVERFLHLVRWGLRALDADRNFMRLVFLHAREVLFGPPTSETPAGIAAELRDRQADNRAVATRMFESMQKSGALRDDVPATEMADLYMLVFSERVARWFRDPDGDVSALEASVIGGLEIVLRGLESCPEPCAPTRKSP